MTRSYAVRSWEPPALDELFVNDRRRYVTMSVRRLHANRGDLVRMTDWWTTLPAWIRYPAALALIVVGLLIIFFSDPVPLTIAGLCVGFGIVGLILSPSDSDKQGYKF